MIKRYKSCKTSIKRDKWMWERDKAGSYHHDNLDKCCLIRPALQEPLWTY